MGSKTIEVPFGASGDRTAIPDASQPSGAVSYTEGFTIDYELDQVTEPSAKDVPRDEMNQLFFVLTEYMQELQQNGLSLYDATINYAVGAQTIASDGLLYHALIINGPGSTVRNPVGDISSSWESTRADVRDYVATFDYFHADIVKGSDDVLYICLVSNGPSTAVFDPVGDTSGHWISLRSDVISYSATTDYAVTDYAKGADGILYRAAIINGPATSVVSPVGDLTGTWLKVGASGPAMTTTIFTSSNPTWAPTPGVRTIKVVATGGGGGGGSIDHVDTVDGVAGAGGAGGSAVATLNAPFDTTYAVVVGALGVGGLAAGGPNNGAAGGTSSFKAITGNGGAGGVGTTSNGSAHNVQPGVAGGTASGGDLNLSGGVGGAHTFNSAADIASPMSKAGDSYWGGGAVATIGGDGVDADATTWGAGGGGAGSTSTITDYAGGDGAPGVVVVEEYF